MDSSTPFPLPMLASSPSLLNLNKRCTETAAEGENCYGSKSDGVTIAAVSVEGARDGKFFSIDSLLNELDGSQPNKPQSAQLIRKTTALLPEKYEIEVKFVEGGREATNSVEKPSKTLITTETMATNSEGVAGQFVEQYSEFGEEAQALSVSDETVAGDFDDEEDDSELKHFNACKAPIGEDKVVEDSNGKVDFKQMFSEAGKVREEAVTEEVENNGEQVLDSVKSDDVVAELLGTSDLFETLEKFFINQHQSQKWHCDLGGELHRQLFGNEIGSAEDDEDEEEEGKRSGLGPDPGKAKVEKGTCSDSPPKGQTQRGIDLSTSIHEWAQKTALNVEQFAERNEQSDVKGNGQIFSSVFLLHFLLIKIEITFKMNFMRFQFKFIYLEISAKLSLLLVIITKLKKSIWLHCLLNCCTS